MEPKEMTTDDIIAEYTRGINDYWSGVAAEGWDEPNANDNPYLAGWNHGADSENFQNFFAEYHDNDD